MQWSDVLREPTPRIVRQFAGLAAALLSGLGLFQILARSRPGLGAILIGAALLLLLGAWLLPRWTRWTYTLAMAVAFPIGLVVSQILLVGIFLVFLVIGQVLRLRGWDPMLRNRRPPDRTYWEPRPGVRDPRRYLRQY
ncbi:MAG: hypothetical protein KF833_19760 [Verrucomicrobiae bacterium]|nr:hypothetical protein [Verrucomicrobiae bacterium]